MRASEVVIGQEYVATAFADVGERRVLPKPEQVAVLRCTGDTAAKEGGLKLFAFDVVALPPEGTIYRTQWELRWGAPTSVTLPAKHLVAPAQGYADRWAQWSEQEATFARLRQRELTRAEAEAKVLQGRLDAAGIDGRAVPCAVDRRGAHTVVVRMNVPLTHEQAERLLG